MEVILNGEIKNVPFGALQTNKDQIVVFFQFPNPAAFTGVCNSYIESIVAQYENFKNQAVDVYLVLPDAPEEVLAWTNSDTPAREWINNSETDETEWLQPIGNIPIPIVCDPSYSIYLCSQGLPTGDKDVLAEAQRIRGYVLVGNIDKEGRMNVIKTCVQSRNLSLTSNDIDALLDTCQQHRLIQKNGGGACTQTMLKLTQSQLNHEEKS